MTPYEYCLSFYRRWAADFHQSFAEIDETDLEMMFDMEILDSRIELAQDEKLQRRDRGQVFIDEIL